MAGMDTTANQNDDRMQTPPPVSGQSYPISLTSQERSNYLRGGLSFTSAYSDNVLGASQWFSGERCELFDCAHAGSGRDDVAVATFCDLRARVHLLPAHQCPQSKPIRMLRLSLHTA